MRFKVRIFSNLPNMNWSETYTALQQNTVEGQENPFPAIDAADAASVRLIRADAALAEHDIRIALVHDAHHSRRVYWFQRR